MQCGVILLLLCVGVIVRAGWVDQDTPLDKRTTTNFLTNEVFDIVMSDEFNTPGRKFNNGEDPMWTGIDRSDDDQTSSGRRSLHFYNSSYITTQNGSLVITTTTENTRWRGWNPYKKAYETMTRHFRSGMLQSWNKFCFTGGILEVDVQLPGKSNVAGLWPAVWLLGNLGRATYEASTNLMWPWSYVKCDRDLQKAQEISGCDGTTHFSLNRHQGRGATEIDLVEVMAGPSERLPLVSKNLTRPYNSMTLQIAPGIPSNKRRPFPGTLPEWGFHWYKNVSYLVNTSINPFFYGTYLAPTKTAEPISRSKEESYQADAISSMGQLDDSFWQSMHTFRLEWEPGENGSLSWYIDGVRRFEILAQSLEEQGSIIPNEPSYLILNTAISTSWGFAAIPPGCNVFDCKTAEGRCAMPPGFCSQLPTQFKIDSVRVYQNRANDKHTLGCNPREYPTKRFILAHEYRYKGLNEKSALLPIRHGKGRCHAQPSQPVTAKASTPPPCGEHGKCVSGRCQCPANWTGSHCLVYNYHNDFPDWDEDHFFKLRLVSPPTFPWSLCIAFALITAAMCAAIMKYYGQERNLKMSVYGYSPIPSHGQNV